MKTVIGEKRGLLPEEREVVDFLTTSLTSHLFRYMLHVPKSRLRTLHKLVSGMVQENVDNMYSSRLQGEAIPTFVKERMLDETSVVVQRGERYFLFRVAATYAFDRVETFGEVRMVHGDECIIFTVASDFLAAFYEGMERPSNLHGFLRELDNGTANDSLASMFEEKWAAAIREEARSLGALTLFDYVERKREKDPTFSTSLFFEQLEVKGHHLHPSAKTKMGMETSSVFAYSPEFHQYFSVRFVAVHRTIYRMTETSNILERYYPTIYQKALHSLREKWVSVRDYVIVPVHPWQFTHVLPVVYAEELENQTVLLLDDVAFDASASSSFRTVFPTEPHLPALKLAVNSQMTSTIRSISGQTAWNSASFSLMLSAIFAEERHLTITPLLEPAGGAFLSDDVEKSRNLSFLLRDSVEDGLSAGEVAIVGSALYAPSPLGRKTILQEMVDVYASPTRFFYDYVAKSLPGFITLMSKYGVALEGHLQNSIVVWKNGEITRFLFRDFGGARVFLPRLQATGIELKLAEGSLTCARSVTEMQEKMYTTVMQSHYGEVIRQLVKSYPLEEADLWEIVKRICAETLSSLSISESAEEDRLYFQQPVVRWKSLTSMRLWGASAYLYTDVQNPLSEGRE